MKKIIAALAAFMVLVAVFSSCDTQHRCAAYGHYSYVPTEVTNQID